MKLQAFKFFAIAGIMSLAISCKDDKDEDTISPKINAATIDGADEDILVIAGGTFEIEASVSDNEALGQFKIDIHDAFDGHQHKSTVAWTYVNILDLSGTSKDVTDLVEVASDATAGPYHCVLRVIDEAGNESDYVELEVMLSNGSEPQINISTPDFSSDVDVNRGSTLVVEGVITDDVDLDEIVIVLEEEGDHDHKSTQEDLLYEADFDLEGTADTSWDFQTDGNVNIAIPTNAEAGHYALIVTAKDSEGNINIFEEELHIL